MSHVVIVGAGPAGASLAFLLARRGIEVTLVERRRDFAREFRGEVLTPSGVEAFAQMGLRSALSELPCSSPERLELYLNAGKVLAVALTDPSDDAEGDDRIVAVAQPALLEMLVSKAGQFDNFTFLRGASVRQLLRHNDRVSGVRIRHENVERDLPAALVIGADGRNSVIRKEAGFTLSHASPPMDIVWCKLPCPDFWPGVRGYIGRGHLLVAYRTWGDDLQLGWVILKGTFDELRSQGVAAWIEEMCNHTSADLAAHIRANADRLAHPFLLDVVSDCVAQWQAPGVMVIGDAAHTMSPVGGQGINIALRDAIVAANHLVPLLSGDAVELALVDQTLRDIEAERLPEVAHIQDLQAMPPRVVLSRSWWGEPARRLLASLLGQEKVRARAATRADAFLYGVTEVELQV